MTFHLARLQKYGDLSRALRKIVTEEKTTLPRTRTRVFAITTSAMNHLARGFTTHLEIALITENNKRRPTRWRRARARNGISDFDPHTLEGGYRVGG